jgi:hypothetical protein
MSKEEKKAQTELAIAEKAGLPAFLGEMMTDAEKDSGFETVDPTKDCALPFVLLLQSGSPKVKGVTKIKGAEEGMFLNTVTDEVYGPRIKVISCAFKSAVVEWKPNRGGIVDNPIEAEALLKKCVKGPKGEDILPNGNILVNTNYHYLLLLRDNGRYERAVASFTSTLLKKSRRWNSQMMSQQIEVSKGVFKRPAMYAMIYTCSSIDEANKLGTWKSWSISEPTLIKDADLYRAAKGFHDDVVKGVVKAVPPAPEEEVKGTPVESTNVM